MKRYVIICIVMGIALGFPAVGWAAYDPAKIQAQGMYVELAQEPVYVGGGPDNHWEYVINFYSDGTAPVDYMLWGFVNDDIQNFHDGMGGWDADYQQNIYQRWDGSAAGKTFAVSGDDPNWDYPSYETNGDNLWEVPAMPYAMDNTYHTPYEYASTGHVYSGAYDIDTGQTYSNYYGSDFVAAVDGLYTKSWYTTFSFDPVGLMATLRIVVEGRDGPPGDFDAGDPAYNGYYGGYYDGEVTWSLPSAGQGDMGGYPVLGMPQVPPRPPPWPYEIDADFMDLFADKIRSGDFDPDFDCDGDGNMDYDDWVLCAENFLEWDSDGDGSTDGVGTRQGDANLDGIVNATDLAILKANFGDSVVGWRDGNANIDDVINATDLAHLKNNFGYMHPGGAAVPEPATLGLLALGGLALLKQRKD